MPVPSRIDSSMVMTSARNRLLSPSPMIQPPKMVPTPVCVIMPMMVPTMAQAMPTVSADLALSASESRQARKRRPTAARERGDQNQTRTTTPATGIISRPSRDDRSDPATSASPIQNT